MVEDIIPDSHPFYLVWTGSLNLGDTPGVFMDAQFAGLLLQVPITLTFLPDGTDPIQLLLTTSEVEILTTRGTLFTGIGLRVARCQLLLVSSTTVTSFQVDPNCIRCPFLATPQLLGGTGSPFTSMRRLRPDFVMTSC